MPTRADVGLAQVTNPIYGGGGTLYLVQTPTGVLYQVFCNADIDLSFAKSLDGGLTWSSPTIVFTGSVTNLAVWYDRWSGFAAGKIYCAYVDSGIDDILFRTIDTEAADALGAQTTVFAGASTASGGALSITRARGGNLVVAGSIDAGAEDGAWESADGGATWAGAMADPSEAATQDQYLLLPGWNADNQDVMLIFWDASEDELSVKRYDDSANTWTETLIAASMVDQAATTAWPHMAAAVDIANSRNLLIAWSAVDAANADLRCWQITDAAITEVTNVVLNSTDDKGLAALAIDTLTGDLYVFYGGKSDGSETFPTALNIYYKVSKDAGTTWGPETILSAQGPYSIRFICTVPRFSSAFNRPPAVTWYRYNTLNLLEVNAPLPMQPQASCLIGI
jgi:hypothetical protein